MIERKNVFLARVQNLASGLVELSQDLELLSQLQSEEFGPGRDNEITTEDLAGTGLTPYKIALISNVALEFGKFLNNQQITPQPNGQYLRQLADKF